MATELQRALATVQAPKVPLSEIRGKSYQAQAQNAQRIEQTNFGKQIPELIKAGNAVYGQYLDEGWKQAKNLYDEAKLADKNPIELAGEYAEKEARSLVGRTKEIIQKGLGIDSLAFTRAYTAEKWAEHQAFQTDAMLQEKIRNGDFKTVEEMKETRQELRKNISADVAKQVGLKPTNPFILQGAVANEQRSEESLVLQQTAVEDSTMRNTRRQMLTENFNNVLKSGVEDPSVFTQMLNVALKDGTLNTREHYEMMGNFANSMADTGNTALLNGFLNQEVTLSNGEVKKFGDVMPVEMRDALFLKADEMYLENNKQLFDNYSRQIGEIGVHMENGNTGAAMAGITKLDNFLNGVQGSGRVTSQMKQLMNLRNQVLVGAARQNNIKKAANDKAAKNMQEQANYKVAVGTALAGGIATTDWNALGISDDNAREATRSMINDINMNPELSPEQRVSQIAHLTSVLPDRSEARKAFSEFTQRGLDAASNAVAQAQYSKVGETPQMPVEAESIIKQYKSNPALFQKVVDPKVFEQTAMLANSVDRLGWDAHINSVAKPLVMDADSKANFDGYMQEATAGKLLTAPEQSALQSRAMENLRILPKGGDMQSTIKQAVDMAMNDINSQSVTLSNGADRLPTAALIPNGRPDAVPLVQAQLDQKVTALRKENEGNDLLYISHDTQGRLSVMSSMTGKPLLVTSAEELYREAGDNVNAQQEALKVRKKAALDKAKADAAKAAKSKKPQVMTSLSGFGQIYQK